MGCHSERPLRRYPEGHDVWKNCKLGMAGRSVPFRRSHICVKCVKSLLGVQRRTEASGEPLGRVSLGSKEREPL